MKNYSKKLFAGAFMALLACSALVGVNRQITNIEPDNTIYDENVVADINRPDFVRMDDEEIPDVKKVVLHYHNDDGKCGSDVTTPGTAGGRAFYVWYNGGKGVEYMPDMVANNGQDMEITLDFSKEEFAGFSGKTMMLFIIKFRKVNEKDENWGGQSSDTELSYFDYQPDAEGKVEVWTMPGSGSDISIFKTEAETKVEGIKVAEFIDWKTIRCHNTANVAKWNLYAYDETFFKMNPKTRDTYKKNYLIKSGEADTTTYDINFKYNAHINMVYSIESLDQESVTGLWKTAYVTYDKLYDDERFIKYFCYDGDDLGFTYTPQQTTFKVWSPTSANMNLLVYTGGASLDYGGTNRYTGYHMNYTGHGVWELTLKGNCAGSYYTYQCDNSSGNKEAVDPYAISTGINGERGYVFNESITNPTGWDDLPVKWDGVEGLDISSPLELSMYEVHIRDFTGDESWGGTEKPGTFKAFVESGTHLPGHPEISTGYDHLNELGIKAVQLLPVFDQDNDETNESEYNWGYNPLNYNSVEGLYSSDPFSGIAKVKEFKELVLKLSQTEARTRVIMDVVFNHVSKASASSFTKLMPKYYFRFLENGEYANGSGCSNEVRTEATMMRKFIVDSCLMWATRYKVKGFRFDLMGLIDTETMRAVKDALYQLDPDIYIYGEGWTSLDGYNGAPGTKGTFTENVYQVLYPSQESPGLIGAFNDAGRNALRGGNDAGWGSSSALPGWGYMSQGTDCSSETRGIVADMLWGIHSGKGGNPMQTINYASCHDNWTLFDQLYYTLGSNGSAPKINDVINASTAAHAFVMMTNAPVVMLGGEEIFRTKELDETDKAAVTSATYEEMYGHYVSHNSYNAPLHANSFKWGNKLSVTRDNQVVDTTGLSAKFAEAIKLHTSLPKYQYRDNDFPYSKTSAGNPILSTSWAGSEKGSSTPQTYNGCAGFQLDEYFIFLAGRQWGWIQFGDVPKSKKVFEFGPNEFDNVNGTVNVGHFDNNTGGAIVVYHRG